MKKKILLISPKNVDQTSYLAFSYIRNLTGKTASLLNVSLPTVAAMTPRDFEVRVIDENAEPIDYAGHYDIVGVGPFPSQMIQAREIMARFRKRGALVVCGGSSVSISPQKWRPYADVLIIGEAERIWPQFLKDYLEGCHRDEYRETEPPDLTLSPTPDFSSIPRSILRQFMGGIVQTNRGCPFDCEFCDAVVYLGHKMRYKTVDQVLREIEQLYRMGMRLTVMVDDNFAVDRKHARTLLRHIGDWNHAKRTPMSFVTSMSIDCAKDEELLELAARAGVLRLIIGIESINEASLRETGKVQNLRSNMLADIRTFHEHGILVGGGCMVGFDHDDLSIFRKQYDFYMQAGIANVLVLPVHAVEGTRLQKRMIEEGRYIDLWKEVEARRASGQPPLLLTPTNNLSIVPKLMTPAQLRQGIYWLIGQFYRWEAFEARLMTFFDNFERSPKKKLLRIPKGRMPVSELGTIGRVLRYELTQAEPDERKVFLRLLRKVRRSSHPQRFPLMVGTFLMAKNLVETILREEPGFRSMPFPGGDTTAPSREERDPGAGVTA